MSFFLCKEKKMFCLEMFFFSKEFCPCKQKVDNDIFVMKIIKKVNIFDFIDDELLIDVET